MGMDINVDRSPLTRTLGLLYTLHISLLHLARIVLFPITRCK